MHKRNSLIAVMIILLAGNRHSLEAQVAHDGAEHDIAPFEIDWLTHPHDLAEEIGLRGGPVYELAPHRFVVNLYGFDLELLYSRSHPLDEFNARVSRVIIVVHGSSRNATDYYDRVQNVADLLDKADETLIIAPQLLEEEDLDPHGLGPQVLYWSGGWRQGHLSKDTAAHPRPARISSFEVVEIMLEQIVVSSLFPSIQQVVFTGHSAGGQYANRFAAGSRIEDNVLAPAGIVVRYVINNPSSYLYYNEDRRIAGTLDLFAPPSAAQQIACPDFNEYKCGLEDLNAYMRATGAGNIPLQYERRNVIHLIGALDNNPYASGLDTSCPAMLQGDHRFERANIYFNYLQHFFGPTILDLHHLGIVHGVGHSSTNMFNSPHGRRYLFDHLGDFDFDGDIDLSDHARFIDSMAGPNMMPAPTLPDVTISQCLDTFDTDSDDDVDIQDAAQLHTNFTS